MRREAFIAAFAAGIAGMGAACTNGGEPLIILQNQVPGENCVISAADTSQTFLPRGIIDTQSSVGYVFNPLVQNNAIAVENQDNLRIVNVQGAEMMLTIQNGVLDENELLGAQAANLISFSKRFAGSIQPDGGTTAFSFTLIDKALLDLLASKLTSDTQRIEVQAEVTVFGSMGGGTVESIPFVYPVDVCNGCMQVSVGACADLSESFVPQTGGECNPLQDVVTECCTAADNSLTCPAVAPDSPGN